MLGLWKGESKAFSGGLLPPVGVPLLGSGAACKLLQLLMDLNLVSRSWAQCIWKAIIPLILSG